MTWSLRHSQNVIFRKTSEVTITRSIIIVFTINLEPYRSLQHELRKEIAGATLMGKGLGKDCIGPEKGKCLNLWCPLMQDMNIMKSSIEIMVGFLEGVKLLQNRERKTVLPIMGKELNVLFGTVSEEESDVVRSKLSTFEKDQLALVQVEKDSISILNITRVELAGNHRSINQLGQDFEKVQVKLKNITETLMIRVL